MAAKNTLLDASIVVSVIPSVVEGSLLKIYDWIK